MNTVIETPPYLTGAKAVGMTSDEMQALVDHLSFNPTAGDLIVGSGGCRKVRVAGRGKGKSGGYRVVTFYLAADGEIYLLAVLSKGSDANFTAGQIKTMHDFVKGL